MALKAFDIPLLLYAHGWNETINPLVNHVGADMRDHLCDVFTVQKLVALLVDNLPLIVSNIVVLKELLTNIEVTALHLTLSTLNRFSDHTALDRLTAFHADLLHDTGHVAHKDAHQVIF